MKKADLEYPCVWLACFGHSLNLAISKALRIQSMESGVRACRHLIQADPELPEHALIHDVITRWGSTFEMISRFLDRQQAVCAVLARDRSTWHLMPKYSDIATLENVNKLLQPVYDLTDALASEKRVTLSSLTPVLEHISILTEQAEDNILTRRMKQVMREVLLEGRYRVRGTSAAHLLLCGFKGSFCKNLAGTVEACVEEAVNPTAAVPCSQQPQAERGENEAGEGSSSSTSTKRKEKSLSGLLGHFIQVCFQRGCSVQAGTLCHVRGQDSQHAYISSSLPCLKRNEEIHPAMIIRIIPWFFFSPIYVVQK